jgi:uncharacterized protein (TIGR02594 family)
MSKDLYAGMPEADKPAVNELVNSIFAQKTGVTRKLARGESELTSQWMTILETVIRNQEKFTSWLKPVGVPPSAKAALDLYEQLNPAPAWIKIARAQLGQREIAGRTHNPRIMEYIYTCTNILETANQRTYVAREGEEGVDWCSCFVNWCLKQAGIDGTNHALASSWMSWGEKLDRPRAGAVALFSWNGTRIDHVAFVDEVNGKFQMLGGNQKGPAGGAANQVSTRSLPIGSVRHYRWPQTVTTA